MANVARYLETYFSNLMDGVRKDFDPKKGNPLRIVSKEAIEETIKKYLPFFEKMITRYTNDLLDEKMTIEQWGREIEDELAQFYLTVAAVGVGHAGRLKPEDIEVVEKKLKEQRKYLKGFLRTLRKLPLTGFSRSYIINRVMLYPGSSAEVAERLRNRDSNRPELPFYPRDGNTLCILHCKCEWDWVELDIDAGDWDVYWVLDHDYENCATCLARSLAASPLIIRNGIITNMPSNMDELIYRR